MTPDQLAKKLETEIDSCDWSMLKAHHERGAVFILEDPISLVDAGVAIATDNVEQIKAWQQTELIRNLRDQEVETFKKEEYRKIAKFLIIQPYVLIKKDVQ